MPDLKKKHVDNTFFGDVYAVAKLIPKGRVTTYGAIAHYLGAKSGARMVGWAMHGCSADVPAHRVVNSAGLLTGKHHFKKPDMMQRLLEKEGVEVLNDKIVRFGDLLWNPTKELEYPKLVQRKLHPKTGYDHEGER